MHATLQLRCETLSSDVHDEYMEASFPVDGQEFALSTYEVLSPAVLCRICMFIGEQVRRLCEWRILG